MTKEEIEELIGLAAGMGLYDDKNPCKRAVILGKAIKELQQEPCKDTISRQETVKYFEGWKNQVKYYHPYAKNFDIPYEEAIQRIKDVPPVNPEKPKIGHCKDCKHFEYDSVAKVDGIPLIVAHEICSKWGDGCKTSEDGYCFLFEAKEGSDKK